MLNVNCTLFYTQNEQQLTHPNTYSVRPLIDEMPCYESNQITQVRSSAITERRTALQGGLVMTKSGKLKLGDNIYGHCRSIFNHCDVFGEQSNRIL